MKGQINVGLLLFAIIGVFIVALIGVSLIPSVSEITATVVADPNVTGATATLTGLVPLLFVILIVVAMLAGLFFLFKGRMGR